jgi:hypothetical protein
MNGRCKCRAKVQEMKFPGFNFLKEYIINIFEEKGKTHAWVLININIKN